jgi:hypothetical protein|tara:strand:- start:208 stop:612 length:405 start_codon:yes stop_codon:yes gene_type:complete
MSTAIRRLAHATLAEFTVATGQAATEGGLATASAADGEVQDGIGDDGIGIFRATAAAGARVEVTLFGGVEVVTVGANGATYGTKAIAVAGAFEDAPAHDSSGATDNAIYGIFMQSGVAGDKVGMMLTASNRGSA